MSDISTASGDWVMCTNCGQLVVNNEGHFCPNPPSMPNPPPMDMFLPPPLSIIDTETKLLLERIAVALERLAAPIPHNG